MSQHILPVSFFQRPAPELAVALLGCSLVRRIGDQWVGGLITETEAYTEDDEASHSFRGPTARNAAMFQKAGTLYVYLIYGIHYCLNISSGNEGQGEAVLIRSIQPLWGVEIMRQLRRWPEPKPLHGLCNGPGKLAQALAIDRGINGIWPDQDSEIRLGPATRPVDKYSCGPRVGISKMLSRPGGFRPWERSVNFKFEEKEDECFTGLDLADADRLADAYQSCEFIQCNFQGADLQKIRFSECTFTSCNLSLSQLKGASFNECHFKDCKLLVLDWTSVASLRSPVFETCLMDANNFAEMQLAYAKFSGSRLQDARFQGAQLKNADFSGCDAQGAEFMRTDLRGCDFRQAQHYQISPTDNKIAKAKFSYPEAMALLESFDIVLE